MTIVHDPDYKPGLSDYDAGWRACCRWIMRECEWATRHYMKAEKDQGFNGITAIANENMAIHLREALRGIHARAPSYGVASDDPDVDPYWRSVDRKEEPTSGGPMPQPAYHQWKARQAPSNGADK